MTLLPRHYHARILKHYDASRRRHHFGFTALLNEQLKLLDNSNLSPDKKATRKVDGQKVRTQASIPIKSWIRVGMDEKLAIYPTE
jgi:hypothetical protein